MGCLTQGKQHYSSLSHTNKTTTKTEKDKTKKKEKQQQKNFDALIYPS